MRVVDNTETPSQNKQHLDPTELPTKKHLKLYSILSATEHRLSQSTVTNRTHGLLKHACLETLSAISIMPYALTALGTFSRQMTPHGSTLSLYTSHRPRTNACWGKCTVVRRNGRGGWRSRGNMAARTRCRWSRQEYIPAYSHLFD